MPTREEILREKTHKDVEELEKRVFYTLTDEKSIQIQRTSKIIGLLIKNLHSSGILKSEEIDEILFDTVML